MAPGPAGRDATRRKSKDQLDWSTCWSNSLKEIAGLLPISEPRNGRGLTKKETLVHMLRYFDFLQSKIQTLQSRLPPHCIPKQEPDTGSESEENTLSEPCTPPHTLKAKRKYACSRSRKRPAPTSEVKAELQVKRRRLYKAVANGKRVYPEEEGVSVPMWGVHSDWSELQSRDSHGAWPVYDSDSQPSSLDSGFSLNQLLPLSTPLEGSSGTLWTPSPTQGGHCSVCEDRTGSESSPSGSGVLDTPTTPITGPGSLFLKDQMLGVIPPMRGQREPFLSPAATPQRPILLPLLPLFGTGDSLNLSPSLLTSPARGLSHCLLPEGQEELHVLFEDVWVTPKTTHTKVSCLPCHDPTDSLSEGEAEVRHGRGGWLSSLSEGEEGDITWTPKQQQVPLKSKTSRTGRHCRANASTKGPPRTPLNLKKKCVNGFIMFCRINRKTYLCTHPGTPSTVVTKELASLWHVMPKQERHVYCLKARRFSRQQNRNVRSELVEGDGEEEDCVPSPLHMLLAQRDLCAAARGGP
ncbi:meiosis initiator protein isoform X2 [Coregonus clupeaformis]|uniref:meiosis initiator protein isoform X2 n=1 Tax=Coregonus clupeaformis TaxID=59861 RepID=UPI001E1C82F9|nr:meiosis initiator protein isoform X2 [Coregonus clupeaformis]